MSDNALLQEIKYDALGRRIETLDYMDPVTGLVSSTPLRTRHLYNGLKVIQEYTVTGSGEGQTSALAREFVWGKRFPDQEVMIDYTAAGDVEANTAEVLYYLHGALGSVVGLADASGNLVEKCEFDPYGRTYISAPDGTARPVSAYGNPFAWTGQRYDPALRLYHFWARSYSPALGRWLQRDPLEYVDGVGLYQYVGGSAIDLTDPLGLVGDIRVDQRRERAYPDGEEPPCPEEDPLEAEIRRLTERAEYLQKVAEPLGEVADALADQLTSDNLHTALDAAGVVDPTPVSDGTNALLYAVEGNWKAAAISVGAVFLAGDLLKFAKNARRLRPGQKIGGAGEAVSPTVKHPTRKRAQDAAQADTAKGKAPVHHPGDPEKGVPPHYHGVDNDGNLKPKHHDHPE